MGNAPKIHQDMYTKSQQKHAISSARQTQAPASQASWCMFTLQEGVCVYSDGCQCPVRTKRPSVGDESPLVCSCVMSRSAADATT